MALMSKHLSCQSHNLQNNYVSFLKKVKVWLPIIIICVKSGNEIDLQLDFFHPRTSFSLSNTIR